MFDQTLKLLSARVLLSVVLGLVANLALAYEYNATTPGTRAAGMAGAFIGQADDASAIFYNPAGLSLNAPDSEVAINVGNAPSYSSDAPSEVTQDDFFVHWISYRVNNYGFAYFQLQDYTLPASSLEGAKNIKNSQWSVAGAWDVHDYIGLGASFDMIAASEDFIWEDNAFGFTFGLHSALLNMRTVGLNAGLTYKTEADFGTYTADRYFGRPQSLALGLNGRFNIASALLNLNYQIETLAWDKITSTPSGSSVIGQYEKSAFGLEVAMPIKNINYALRFGSATATEETTLQKPQAYDYDSSTFGFGANFSENYTVDIANEVRDYDLNGVTLSETFITVALTVKMR
ncbi:MAG: hypothetical protein H0W44_09455 [Gammaproteobacteria bacterium]|nr:hypothetical protein [Gammaproteobacteria bacterium]